MAPPSFDRPPVTNGHPGRATVGRLQRNGDRFRLWLALGVLLWALLAAGILTGLLFAVGAIGNTTSTTGQLNATAIYQDAAPGVVTITARGIGAGPGGARATAAGTGFVIDSRGDSP